MLKKIDCIIQSYLWWLGRENCNTYIIYKIGTTNRGGQESLLLLIVAYWIEKLVHHDLIIFTLR